MFPRRNQRRIALKFRIVPLAAALAFLGIAASPAFSQSPKPAIAPKPPTHLAGAPARVAEALPQLSEVERLKIENLTLKAQALQGQLQELNRQYSELVGQITAEHPGYIYNPTNSSLVPALHVDAAPAGEPKK